MSEIQLARFVTMTDHRSVYASVQGICRLIYPDYDVGTINSVFSDIVKMFNGEYKGYKPCNTGFHNLQHTTDVFLASARLIHGYILKTNENISAVDIEKLLLSTLFHDIGYIQPEYDNEGTGAKYTNGHEERGIAFLAEYLGEKGFSDKYIGDCGNIIMCTDISTPIDKIPFTDKKTEVLGKILASADLLGQMADRTYLEKLLFLFYEFKEGGIDIYNNEFELLENTVTFSKFAIKRLECDLDNYKQYMVYHFKNKWGVNFDPYMGSIKRHLDYLQMVVCEHKDDYREYLKRDGMIDRLTDFYGNMMV